jgi:hypothetical protein
LPWPATLVSGLVGVLAVYQLGKPSVPPNLARLQLPLVFYTATSFAAAFITALS